jgi:hypothetical protein
MALVAHNVYAYTSADDAQVFVKGADLTDLGDWSSTVTYSFRQAAVYNGAYYVCLAANTNTPPSGNISDEWSVLVLVRESGSSGHTADEAYALAETAFETAVEVGQGGSNYSFELFIAGTNYTNNTAVTAIGTAVQHGSEFAYDLFIAGTNYTNTQAVAAVQAEAVARANADLVEAGARVYGDGTTAQHGSNYAFDLFVAGTNFTQTQAIAAVTAEAAIRAQHDIDEATARVFGDGTTLAAATSYANALALNSGSIVGQAGSDYAFNLFVQGTNYANGQVAVESSARQTAITAEAAARVFGDGTTAQHGSEHAYDLYISGTNYTNGQVSTAVISANQAGSAYAFSLYVAGTNFSTGYTDAAVASEAVLRAAADALIRTDGTIFTVTQVGAEATTRAAADLLIRQQGSQFTTIVRDQGTNYTDSRIAVEVASRVAGDFNTFVSGTNYTAAQIASLQISSGSSSLALYWAGTNYTNAQVGAEAVTRAAADTSLSNSLTTESSTRATADANMLSAIVALQAILGISLQGTVAYYMAQVPRGQPETKLTFINGVMTSIVAGPYIWDDFSLYGVGPYNASGTVTVPVSVSAAQSLIYGNAWGSYGTISTDIFSGTVAQDPITDYVLNGTANPLDKGLGWASAGTFAVAFLNQQVGFDLFETYATGTVNTANPINDGTFYIQQAVLFSY